MKYSLNEFPDYYARPDGINIKRNPNNQLGYMARSTSKYIYLLASPFKKRQERVDNVSYKDFVIGILVYSLQGQFMTVPVLISYS